MSKYPTMFDALVEIANLQAENNRLKQALHKAHTLIYQSSDVIYQAIRSDIELKANQ